MLSITKRLLGVVMLGIGISYTTVATVYGENTAPKVIVNKNVVDSADEPEQMTITELIDIFTRKRTHWNDNTEIVVVTRSTTSIPAQNFFLEVLGITPYQYRSRLQRNLYEKQTKRPIEVSSEEEMINIITNNKQAIGYIYNYILVKNNERIVIIKIDK